MPKYTIEFADGATEKIDQLLETTTAEERSQVVRNALTLFQYLVPHVMKPNTHLAVVAGDEIKKIIIVPGVTYPTRFQNFLARVKEKLPW